MSPENVELVKGVYELLPIGGILNHTPDQIDQAFRDYLDGQFEFRLPDYPEGAPVFRGRDGVAQFTAMLGEAWDEWLFEPQEFLDAGDRVVVSGRILGKGEASGVRVELDTTHVWTIRNGRAVSADVYRDRSEALKAAGLSE
jgi:ketosteroid isomerase-like protein